MAGKHTTMGGGNTKQPPNTGYKGQLMNTTSPGKGGSPPPIPKGTSASGQAGYPSLNGGKSMGKGGD